MHSYLKDDVQYSGREREKNRLISVYSDWKSKLFRPGVTAQCVYIMHWTSLHNVCMSLLTGEFRFRS